jgi:hypothetical protein
MGAMGESLGRSLGSCDQTPDRRIAICGPLVQRIDGWIIDRFDPRRWFAMLLIEAWNQDHLAWWKGEPDARCRWSRPEILTHYIRGGLPVGELVTSTDGKPYPLHWLYAYRIRDREE